MTHESLLPPDPWQPAYTIGFYADPLGTWVYLHPSLGAQTFRSLPNNVVSNLLVAHSRGNLKHWLPPGSHVATRALLQSQAPPVDEEG